MLDIKGGGHWYDLFTSFAALFAHAPLQLDKRVAVALWALASGRGHASIGELFVRGRHGRAE